MQKDRFEHLTGRQKAACYFIMDTLGVYLAENETPEEFLTKYLTKAKKKLVGKTLIENQLNIQHLSAH